MGEAYCKSNRPGSSPGARPPPDYSACNVLCGGSRPRGMTGAPAKAAVGEVAGRVVKRPRSAPAAAEFFSGIGLARMGLEAAGFSVVWANDIDAKKRAMYAGQFGQEGAVRLDPRDVKAVSGSDLPAGLALAWASFPCTDLSLAGGRDGLGGRESGTFWEFVRVLREMGDARPPAVALENVVGLGNSMGGRDLVAIGRALNDLGYSVDALVLDARRWVPQSRPRLFVIGAAAPTPDTPRMFDQLRPGWLRGFFSDPGLRTHRALLPEPPEPLDDGLSSLADRLPQADPSWWPPRLVEAFVGSLSTVQRRRLEELRDSPSPVWRTAYRRTRRGVAVWEIRPEDVAGCLRTARGGSSRQAVLEISHGSLRVRWMTPREYARLMGAGDYRLEGSSDNQLRTGFGDAVCVPAVKWLAVHYLRPLALGRFRRPDRRAAVRDRAAMGVGR